MMPKFFKPDRLQAHHSPLRSMIAETGGTPYVALKTLAAAQHQDDGIVIFEGDYGGTIYLTVPARLVKCSEAVLQQLLADLDKVCWGDRDGARIFYEAKPIGSGVAGGMGGGLVTEGVWLHPKVEAMGTRSQIAEVVAGLRERFETAGRRWT